MVASSSNPQTPHFQPGPRAGTVELGTATDMTVGGPFRWVRSQATSLQDGKGKDYSPVGNDGVRARAAAGTGRRAPGRSRPSGGPRGSGRHADGTRRTP